MFGFLGNRVQESDEQILVLKKFIAEKNTDARKKLDAEEIQELLPKKRLCRTVSELDSEIQSGTWDKKLYQAVKIYLRDINGPKIVSVELEKEKILELLKNNDNFLIKVIEFFVKKFPENELTELFTKYIDSKKINEEYIENQSDIVLQGVMEILNQNDKDIEESNFGDYISQTSLNAILGNTDIDIETKNSILSSKHLQELIDSYIEEEQELTRTTLDSLEFSNILLKKALSEFIKEVKECDFIEDINEYKYNVIFQKILKLYIQKYDYSKLPHSIKNYLIVDINSPYKTSISNVLGKEKVTKIREDYKKEVGEKWEVFVNSL